MPLRRFSQRRVVPFSAEQMFDLVVDVERYREFLPGWAEARIRERSAHVLLVEQALGLAGMRVTFTSRAEFLRPEYLRISAEPGLFRSLEICWEFVDLGDAGCRIAVDLEFALRSRLLGSAAAGVLNLTANELLPRFEDRARRLLQRGEL